MKKIIQIAIQLGVLEVILEEEQPKALQELEVLKRYLEEENLIKMAVSIGHLNVYCEVERAKKELCKMEELLQEDDEIKNLSIYEIEFSHRTLNALETAGYMDIRTLSKLTPGQITLIRGIGRKSVSEVAQKLANLGVDNSAWIETIS